MPNESPADSASVTPHQQAAANLYALIESTEELIWSVDLNYGILAFNSALQRHVERNFGIQIAVGKRPEDLLPPERAAIWPPLFQRAITQGPYRAEVPFPGNRTMELSFNPIVVHGQVTGLSMFGKDVTERKSADESRRFLASIVETSDDAIIAYNPGDGILTWNRGAEAIFGYSAEEAIGRPLWLIVPPERRASVTAYTLDLIGGHAPQARQGVGLCKDGRRIRIAATSCPIRDAQSQVSAISIIVRDVTQQHAGEEARALLASVVSSSIEAIHAVTLEGKVVTWNYGAESLFGYSPEEIVGQSIAVLAPPGRNEEVAAFLKHLGQGGVIEPFDTTLLAKGGEEIDVSLSISPIRNAEGQVVGASGIARDIRERKRIERELKQAEKKFREIFDGALEGMFQTTLAGKCLMANLALARMLGYATPEEVVAAVTNAAWDVWVDPGNRVRFLHQLEEKGVVLGHECQFKRKDNTIIWVSLNCRKNLAADGRTLVAEGFIEDITERRETEMALRESLDLLQETQIIGALGSYVLDIPSGAWTSSDVLDELFGVGKEYDRTVAGWTALIHPDDRAMMAEYFAYEVVARKQRFEKEYRIVRVRDKAERWLHGIGKLEFDAAGQPIRMRGVIKDVTERKLAELKIRDSEETYRATFEQAAVGIIQTALDGRILGCNARFAEIVGYPLDELHLLTVQQITAPQHLDESLVLLRQLSSGVIQSYTVEKRYIRKDGSLTWVRLSVSTRRDQQGRALNFIAMVEDINARKAAEDRLASVQEALRTSEAHYRTVFQTSVDGICISRLSDGGYVDVNKAFLDLMGFEREEMVGAKSIDLNIWAQPEVRNEMLQALVRDSSFRDWETRFIRKDGKQIWTRLSASLIDIDGIPCVLSIVRDIGVAKAAEQRLAAAQEALRLSEERYRTAFQTSLDAININRLHDGLYIDCNKAFLDTLGFTRGEIVGQTSLDLNLWVDREDRDKLVGSVLRHGSCQNLEARFRKKNGEILWGLMSASLMMIGGIPCVISITRDVTAAKAAEQLLAGAVEALRISEERYRTVFETSFDGIIIHRIDNGICIDVNPKFLEFMGYTREQVLGKTAQELGFWADLQDRANMFRILAVENSIDGFEAQFRKKSGETAWALLSASISEIDEIPCITTVARDISDAKAAEAEIRNLAFFDTLTGLPNRRLLLERLRQSLAAGQRSGRMRALLFIDLDNFKTLNDTLGHQTGDLLLQETARRLTACVREGDTVGRLGGDEFVLMLEDLSEHPEEAAAQAKLVGEKLLAVVAQPYVLNGRECRSGASIGISVFGDRRESINEILQQADIAMYQAKAAGRNALRFFAPALQAAVNARAALEDDLRLAIQTNQFVLYFQPQIDRNRLAGAEALIRWHHPWRNILSPNEFIPLAEETGLILPLGKWVLETVCGQIAAWAHRKSAARLTVAINISARQFRQPDFVEQVLSALQRTGANPANLRLELTESMLVENFEEVIAKMTELKSHGLRFSLDDFGTGYSSLAYLKRLPLDQLKIDRSFIRDLLTDESSAAIAQTIISLSRAMGLPVIAEGVETEQQRDFLTRLGCHAFQGFLYSRPIPLDEFQRNWLPETKEEISAAS